VARKTLAARFVAWLESLADPGRGHQTEIERLTGIPQDWLSRAFSGELTRVSLDTVEQAAANMGLSPAEVFEQIQGQARAGSSVQQLEARLADEASRHLASLARRDPRIMRQLIAIESVAADLGYAEALTAIGLHLCAHGPERALPKILQEVVDLGRQPVPPARARARARARLRQVFGSERLKAPDQVS